MTSEPNETTKPVRIPAALHAEIKSDTALNGEKLGEAVVEQLRKRWPGNARNRRQARRMLERKAK